MEEVKLKKNNIYTQYGMTYNIQHLCCTTNFATYRLNQPRGRLGENQVENCLVTAIKFKGNFIILFARQWSERDIEYLMGDY